MLRRFLGTVRDYESLRRLQHAGDEWEVFVAREQLKKRKYRLFHMISWLLFVFFPLSPIFVLLLLGFALIPFPSWVRLWLGTVMGVLSLAAVVLGLLFNPES